MQEELSGLSEQGTWEIVDKPPDANLLRTKWVFKKKVNKEGEVIRYRARLVVKGYTQVHGVDYDETYSPVVRHSTLRIVLALCAHYGLYTKHLDVPKAFPQSDIDYECYMHAPTGTTLPKGKCYKLLKSIYGLKQASRLFHHMLSQYLTSVGFTQCVSDTCVYYYQNGDDFAIACIYVDDIFLAASNIDLISQFSNVLHEKFNTNDLGQVDWFLGIRIYTSSDRHTIQLSQSQYVHNILDSLPIIDDLNTSPIPMAPTAVLSKSMSPQCDDDKLFMETVPYRRVVGQLMYLMVCTRPDIAFAVCTVARFLSNPGRQHWNAVLNILKYLKGTPDLRITYKRQGDGPPAISGFCDANWATFDVDKRRSHTGFVFYLSGGPIAWKSKLQTSIALSSMDSEYYAMGDATKESMSLGDTYHEVHQLRQCHDSKKSTTIYVDNTSAIKLAQNPVFHRRSKHIAIRHHFIRQLLTDGIVDFQYISTQDNLADLFTKPLAKPLFRRLRRLVVGECNGLL
mmetsp:Transcript_17870/g.26381  ORF Transcript_17870/g.26381 Transcript_17870/m.26381 type:complete len:511 (+) Transcript_17870:541-2073(+)